MARKNLVADSPSNGPLPWQGAAFVGLFAVLVLWQGGYYAAPACAVGIAAAGCGMVSVALARSRGRSEGCLAIPLLFAGVGACSLVSGAVHGLTLTGLAESAPWFAVAALAFLHGSMPGRQRAKTMRTALWLGVASSVLGLALMAEPGTVAGAVNAGRLQFPFQYANASGIWFAACAVLALGSGNGRLRKAAVFPLTALLFTQSAGACALLACAFVVLCIGWLRSGAFARVTEAALLAACAASAFAFCFVVGSNGALPCAAGAFVVGSLAIRKLGRAKNVKGAAVVACALLVGCVLVCVGVLVQTGRAGQAGQTFVERLIQMGDAGAVVAANPVFGIGPDAWRFLYPYVQSAQYTATSVHCGYLQVALDAGLVGAALLVAAIVSGARRAISCGNVPVACAILMIAAHGAFDIDFQFAALLAFWAMLLTSCPPPTPIKLRGLQSCGGAGRFALTALFLTAVMMVSACGLWAAGVKGECASAAEEGETETIRQAIGGNILAERDDSVRLYYGEALWRAGAWSELAQVYNENLISAADQALFVAEALYALGDGIRAESVLLTELEREPGNVELFERARLLLATHDASEEAQKRYRLAAEHANDMTSTGLASLLRNQEQFPETLS